MFRPHPRVPDEHRSHTCEELDRLALRGKWASTVVFVWIGDMHILKVA
jgi:hypothetical protein